MMSLALLILVLTSWVAFVLPDSSPANATAEWITTGGIALGFVCLIIYCCRQSPRWRFLLIAGIAAAIASYLTARHEIQLDCPAHWLWGVRVHPELTLFAATMACHAAFSGFLWASLGVLAAMALPKDRTQRLLPIGFAVLGGLLIGRTWQYLVIPINQLAWNAYPPLQAVWIGAMIGLDVWQLPCRIQSVWRRRVLAASAIAVVVAGITIAGIDSSGPCNTYRAWEVGRDGNLNVVLDKMDTGNLWVVAVGAKFRRLLFPKAVGCEPAIWQYVDNERYDASAALDSSKSARVLSRLLRMARKPQTSALALDVLKRSDNVEAIDPLIAMLRDPHLDPHIRKETATTLGTLECRLLTPLRKPEPDPAVVAKKAVVLKALIAAAADGPGVARSGALEAISNLAGDDVLPLVLRYAGDKDPAVRCAAVAELRHKHAETATPLLIKALSDSDFGVRYEAVLGLVEMPSKSAIPALSKSLRGKDEVVAMLAARALSRTRDKSVIPTIEAARGSIINAWPAKSRNNMRHALDELIQDVREDKPIENPNAW